MIKKDITPMKRLSHIISEFKEIVDPCFMNFNLNKAEPSTYYMGHQSYTKKGVVNDFLLVFEERQSKAYKSLKQIKPTFAFVFTYMGLDNTQHNVAVTIKNEHENIISSPLYSVDDFKQKIKEFNQSLKSYENLDKNTIYQKINEIFISNHLKYLQSPEYLKIMEEMEKKYQVNHDKERLQVLEEKLLQNQQMVKQLYQKSPEIEEIKKLKESLEDAYDRLNKKLLKLEKDYHLKKINDDIDNLVKTIENNQNKLSSEMKIMKKNNI